MDLFTESFLTTQINKEINKEINEEISEEINEETSTLEVIPTLAITNAESTISQLPTDTTVINSSSTTLVELNVLISKLDRKAIIILSVCGTLVMIMIVLAYILIRRRIRNRRQQLDMEFDNLAHASSMTIFDKNQ